MMSHCTASFKLTPWHEGTFASSVIYSLPNFPLPLPFTCFWPSISSLAFTPASKMTFIILSLSRSHSFPVAQGLMENRRKSSTEKGKMPLSQVLQRQLKLSYWPTALAENGSLLQCGERNVTESLGKCSCTYEAEFAGSGQKEGIVCQAIYKDFSKLQSQMARFMLQLSQICQTDCKHHRNECLFKGHLL